LLPLFGDMPESSSSDEVRFLTRASQRSRPATTACDGRVFAARRRRHYSAGAAGRGFTLIELLAAIAIVAVLAAIVLGSGGRTSEMGRVAKARAELVAISAALETFAREHGDYPHASENETLVQSLAGRRGPSGGRVANGRVYLAAGELTWRGDPATDSTATLVDPWGNAYCYFYKTGPAAEWSASRYVLYSAGPNGLHQPPHRAIGFVDLLIPVNADNIYADE
jgi:general secretion pathway protein G